MITVSDGHLWNHWFSLKLGWIYNNLLIKIATTKLVMCMKNWHISDFVSLPCQMVSLYNFLWFFLNCPMSASLIWALSKEKKIMVPVLATNGYKYCSWFLSLAISLDIPQYVNICFSIIWRMHIIFLENNVCTRVTNCFGANERVILVFISRVAKETRSGIFIKFSHISKCLVIYFNIIPLASILVILIECCICYP